MADGLHDTLQDADLILTDGNQQGKRRTPVEQPRENSTPATAPGNVRCGISNFVAHYRGEFQSDKPKANYAEGIQHETLGLVGIRKSATVMVVPKREPNHDA